MTKLRYCSGLLIPLLLLFLAAPSQGALLFSSGFEDGVSLSTPYSSGGYWWQTITGSDEGYDWLSNMPGKRNIKIQSLIPTSETYSTYMESKIQNVIGHTGARTRAWYMYNKREHYKSGPPYYTAQRVATVIVPGSESPDNLTEYCEVYWARLNPLFNDSMVNNSWVNFWEQYVSGGAHGRNSLYIIRMPTGGGLIWKLTIWDNTVYTNSSVPVPVDLEDGNNNPWFKVTIYYKHSSTSGEIGLWINDQEVFDYSGATCGSGNPGALNSLKAYSNRGDTGWWIDDLKIYDSLPGAQTTPPSTPRISIIN